MYREGGLRRRREPSPHGRDRLHFGVYRKKKLEGKNEEMEMS
jgi:hypothetical protein